MCFLHAILSIALGVYCDRQTLSQLCDNEMRVVMILLILITSSLDLVLILWGEI